MPPNGGYTGFYVPQRLHPQPRDLAAGRRLPHDPHRQVPQRLRRRTVRRRQRRAARLERLAHGPQGRHRPLLLRLHAEQQRRRSTAPSATPGSWDTREYGERDDFGCPFAPLNGQPCFYETDIFNRIASEELAGDARRNSPSTCSSTTPPRTATSAARPGRSRRPATTTPSPAPATRTAARRASTRATSTTSRASSAKRPTSRSTEIHTYRVYYQKALESLRSVDEGVKQVVDTLGALQPAAQHLHHLHLRQRLLLRRAPPDRRQVPRLRAGHPPALPDPRPGDQTRHLDRRAGRQHRHRADDPRTGRRDGRQKHRRPLAGPLHERPGPAHPPAAPLRVLRRDQRRRSQRRTDARSARRQERRSRARRRPAPAPRSSRRRRTTRGSASAPTSTSSGPTARKSSTTSPRTPTSSTTSSGTATSRRSATSSTPS